MLVVVASPAALAQTFLPQGPAPIVGERSEDFREALAWRSAAGAMQAVVADPLDAGTLYAGGVNGGVWVTRNGGTSWTPLTDKQASLSIGSLALDPTDAARKTLIAGIGLTSSGNIAANFDQFPFVANRGGARTGLLYSTDGGSSWSGLGTTELSGKSVIGVAARGSVMMAAVVEPWDLPDGLTPTGGLYRSTNGGASFQAVGSGTGLGAGPVFALAGDQVNPNRLYAAVGATAAGGVYVSNDAGASWNLGLATTATQAARLGTGPGGSVVAAIWDTTSFALVDLKLSKDGGRTWTSLGAPAVSPGGQAWIHLAVTIDPGNANIVYVAGDRLDNPPYSANVFRVTLNADGSSTAVAIVDAHTADRSTAHPDTRALTFDANGRLIMAGDGGIYARSQPGSSAGGWTGLNNGLSTTEPYRIAYDAVSKRVALALQDNGTVLQMAPGGSVYRQINDGDGVNVAINDRTLGNRSVIYSSAQYFGDLARTTVDAQGRTVAVKSFTDADGNPLLNLESGDFTSFSSPFVLNKIDPTRIAFGTQYAYVTRDAGAASDTLTLTNVGIAGSQLGQVSAMAFGTTDNPDALLVGARFGSLYLSATATPGSLQHLTAYAGGSPSSVVFDARNFNRFYVADTASLWGSTNTGASFTDLTPSLAALNIIRPVAVEFISSNGVNALMAGGVVSVASAQSPIAVADSDASGTLSNWRTFGSALPNTVVTGLAYNPLVDVLAVGLWGRGAWVLYDVTSYFPSATVLRFGLADNDSAPDASFLTGTRPLEKVGAGTLIISGNTSYTGSTSVKAGMLIANASLASSSGLTVDGGAIVRGLGTLPTATIAGTLWPGIPGVIGNLAVSGNLAFTPGSAFRIDATPQAASRVNVTGGAALGGTVTVTPVAAAYGSGRRYTILSAAGGLNGSFGGVSSPLPFLQAALSYDANNVTLSLTPGGFAQAATNPNQAAAAAALERGVAGASGDFLNVVNAFTVMTVDQATAALQSISGQGYTGFASLGVQTLQLFMNTVAQQAGSQSAAGGSTRTALAEACDVACESPTGRWSAWGGPLGGVGTIAGSSAAPGASFNIGGFAAGLDRRFDSGLILGVTAGYSTANQYSQTLPGIGTSGTLQAGLYGSYSADRLYLDALAGYARSDLQMTRPISVSGLAPRTAFGRTTADQLFGQVEAGYRIGLSGPHEPAMAPFARLQGSTTTQAGFSETGADSLNLSLAAQTTNSLRSVLGVQGTGAFDLGWREKLSLGLRLGWSHEYADTSRPMTASFAGAPAFPFTVNGSTSPRDGAIVGFSANTAIAEATSVYLRYDGELAGGSTSHILSAGVRLSW